MIKQTFRQYLIENSYINYHMIDTNGMTLTAGKDYHRLLESD